MGSDECPNIGESRGGRGVVDGTDGSLGPGRSYGTIGGTGSGRGGGVFPIRQGFDVSADSAEDGRRSLPKWDADGMRSEVRSGAEGRLSLEMAEITAPLLPADRAAIK